MGIYGNLYSEPLEFTDVAQNDSKAMKLIVYDQYYIRYLMYKDETKKFTWGNKNFWRY